MCSCWVTLVQKEESCKQGARLHLEVLNSDKNYSVIWYLFYLGVVFKV